MLTPCPPAPEPVCLPLPLLQASPQPPGPTLGVPAHWALGEGEGRAQKLETEDFILEGQTSGCIWEKVQR